MSTEKPSPIKFKARIKNGAPISQDFGFFRWPECKPPKVSNMTWEADDPDMEFEAYEQAPGIFDLSAPGYGVTAVPDQYGNGSIHVRGIEHLIVADDDRRRVLGRVKDRKRAEIAEAETKLAKLRAELAAIND